MDWFLSFLVVITNIIIGRKIKWGWVLMVIGALLWIYYAVYMLHPAQYGLIPASLLNVVVGITSFIKWYKDDKKLREALDSRWIKD